MTKSLAIILGCGLGLLVPNYPEVSYAAQQEQMQEEKKPIDLRQDRIKKGIEDWVCCYIDEAGKNLKHVTKAIRSQGAEKVRSPFMSIASDYLALAREKADNPKKYDEREQEEQCHKISRSFLSGLGEVLKDTPIDYSKDKIREAWAKWVNLKINFSVRLLASDNNTEGYSELVRKTFSPEEYRDFLEREIKILNEVYDGLEASITGVAGLFAKDEINKDRKLSVEFCEKKAYEYYPEAKPKKEKSAEK